MIGRAALLAASVMLLALAGCGQLGSGKRSSCRIYDEFGARLSVTQCAGSDQPAFGQYHEYPPAAEEPTGVGSHN